MTDITSLFTELIVPKKILAIYQREGEGFRSTETYVESFDLNTECLPINAHPLSAEESIALAECFNNIQANKRQFTNCVGLLPTNVLRVDHNPDGSLIWFTKARKVYLLFTEESHVKCGSAYIPSMIWIANNRRLRVYALKDNKRPTLNTSIYFAPFFNVYTNGNVCMGTVSLNSLSNLSMQPFMERWEELFFGSYFKHPLNQSAAHTDLYDLWREQICTKNKFPTEKLKNTNLSLKDIIL